MRLRGLFTKSPQRDDVQSTKVLVASLDSKFDELLKADIRTYSQSYPNTTTATLTKIDDFLVMIERGYDIVHLFSEVSPVGLITDGAGTTLTGTRLIEVCCDSDVKLLWVASENSADGYIKGFNLGGKHINLVMTINRNGSKFSSFLDSLLSRMSQGETMPAAWVAIAPQGPRDPPHQELPATIFAAGRGGVRFR